MADGGLDDECVLSDLNSVETGDENDFRDVDTCLSSTFEWLLLVSGLGLDSL